MVDSEYKLLVSVSKRAVDFWDDMDELLRVLADSDELTDDLAGGVKSTIQERIRILTIQRKYNDTCE